MAVPDANVILFDFVSGLVSSLDGAEVPIERTAAQSPSSCMVRLNALVREAERRG